MDKTWFDALPALCNNRAHVFEEIHLLLCPPPRPVAVKIAAGHRKLPEDLWPVGELIVRALQGADVYTATACQIGAFLTQLLRQAIAQAGVLETNPCLDGREILSVLTARAKPAQTMAKQRHSSKQMVTTDAKAPKEAKNEAPQPAEQEVVQEVNTEIEHPNDAENELVAEYVTGTVKLEPQNGANKAFVTDDAPPNKQHDSQLAEPNKWDAANAEPPNETETLVEAGKDAETEPDAVKTAKQRRRRRQKERRRLEFLL